MSISTSRLPSPSATRIFGWLGKHWRPCLVAALVLAASLGRLALVSYHHLWTPTDLGFEGPNLSSILLIKGGHNPYSPEVYEGGPHAFTMYPPAYHYVASLLPIHPGNPYLSGRLLALACMAGAAAVLLARCPSPAALLTRAVLAALFFLVPAVTSNTAFLKNDSMALCFSVWAVHLIADRHSRGRTCAAVVLCSAALMAKQSYLSAGVTCAVVALCRREQRATFLTTALAVGAGVAALSWALWGKQFWFCIFEVAHNPRHAWQAGLVLGQLARHATAVATVVLLLAGLGTACHLRAGRELFLRPSFLYCLVTWTLFFITVPKLGSSTNYIFEPLLASLVWIAQAHEVLVARARLAPLLRGAAILVLAAAAIELRWGRDYTFAVPAFLGAARRTQERVQEELAARDSRTDHPVLNLHAATSFLVAGTPATVNDPFLYKLLWKDGRLRTAALETALAAERFRCVFLPAGAPPDPLVDSPALDRIMNLVDRHYPERRAIGDLEVAFRKAQP